MGEGDIKYAFTGMIANCFVTVVELGTAVGMFAFRRIITGSLEVRADAATLGLHASSVGRNSL